jgi:hypothetical protein
LDRYKVFNSFSTHAHKARKPFPTDSSTFPPSLIIPPNLALCHSFPEVDRDE